MYVCIYVSLYVCLLVFMYVSLCAYYMYGQKTSGFIEEKCSETCLDRCRMEREKNCVHVHCGFCLIVLGWRRSILHLKRKYMAHIPP